MIFGFKLMKLPHFFLDRYYKPEYISRVIFGLDMQMPTEKKKRGSSAFRLNKDSLSKLGREEEAKSPLTPLESRSSVGEPNGGGSYAGSVAASSNDGRSENGEQAPRGGSVRSFGFGKSLGLPPRRPSAAQRSGSHVTSQSDLERIDKYMNVAPHANKYIVKYFGSYWEEMRNKMNLIR